MSIIQRIIYKLKTLFTHAGCPYLRLRKKILMLIRMKKRHLALQYLKGDASLDPVVKSVNTDGFAILDQTMFAQSDLEKLDQIAEQWKSEQKLYVTKDQGKIFWKAFRPEHLQYDDALVKIALSRQLLDIATSYLGESALLANVGLYASYGIPESMGWLESQLWHKDWEDQKMMKFFIYLNDVRSSEDGPFTFLPGPFSDKVKVKKDLVPRRILDQEMMSLGLEQHAHEIKGQKFSMFLVDTNRCYHRGSRMKGDKVRLIYTATFVSYAPIWSGIKPRSSPQVTAFISSPLEKIALGAI